MPPLLTAWNRSYYCIAQTSALSARTKISWFSFSKYAFRCVGHVLSWCSAHQMMIFPLVDQRYRAIQMKYIAQCVGTLRLQSHHYHLLLWRGSERGQTNAKWSEGTDLFCRLVLFALCEVRSFVRPRLLGRSAFVHCKIRATRQSATLGRTVSCLLDFM